MLIQFKSRYKQDVEAKCPRQYQEFSFSGYADRVIIWSNESDRIPDADITGDIPSLDRTPIPNQIIVCCVFYPFNQDMNQEFWATFISGAAKWNGWGKTPEDLNNSAFIKCKAVDILEMEEDSAWIKIQIIEVLKLNSIHQRIREISDRNNFIDRIFIFDRADVYFYKNWIYYCGNGEGDVGTDLIIRNEHGKYNLIYFEEYIFDDAYAYIGNLSLSAKIVKKLIAK
jgi:hypothetical protein